MSFYDFILYLIYRDFLYICNCDTDNLLETQYLYIKSMGSISTLYVVLFAQSMNLTINFVYFINEPRDELSYSNDEYCDEFLA